MCLTYILFVTSFSNSIFTIGIFIFINHLKIKKRGPRKNVKKHSESWPSKSGALHAYSIFYSITLNKAIVKFITL